MLKHLLLPSITIPLVCKLVTDIFLWLQFTQQKGIELTPTTSQWQPEDYRALHKLKNIMIRRQYS
jgi:hypothetical protein